jgi:flagellar biosynthesis regulator FlaF
MSKTLSFIEEQAFQLSQAAILLDRARSERDADPKAFEQALTKNLDVWIVIRTIAQQDTVGYTADLKSNLINLSHFVAKSSMVEPSTLGDSTIDTLININLQISEGLLEGAAQG